MKNKFEFFRNFGSLTNNSVTDDIYKKRISTKRKKQMGKPKASKCITRMATEEERKKYKI